MLLVLSMATTTLDGSLQHHSIIIPITQSTHTAVVAATSTRRLLYVRRGALWQFSLLLLLLLRRYVSPKAERWTCWRCLALRARITTQA